MRRKARSGDSGAIEQGSIVNGSVEPTDGGIDASGGTAPGDSTGGAGSTAEFIEPASLASSSGDTPGEPARTRRKYTKRASGGDTAKAQLGVSALETILHSIHLGIATLTQAPEMMLDPTEAEAMAKAVAAVGRHYPAFQMSEKAADWGNLIVLACGVYGPRFMAVRNRKAATRPTPQAAQPQAPRQGTAPASNGATPMTRVKIPGTNIETEVPIGGWNN